MVGVGVHHAVDDAGASGHWGDDRGARGARGTGGCVRGETCDE